MQVEIRLDLTDFSDPGEQDSQLVVFQ